MYCIRLLCHYDKTKRKKRFVYWPIARGLTYHFLEITFSLCIILNLIKSCNTPIFKLKFYYKLIVFFFLNYTVGCGIRSCFKLYKKHKICNFKVFVKINPFHLVWQCRQKSKRDIQVITSLIQKMCIIFLEQQRCIYVFEAFSASCWQ